MLSLFTASVRIRYIRVSDSEARNVQRSRLRITTLYRQYYCGAIYQEEKQLIFVSSQTLWKRVTEAIPYSEHTS